MKKTHAWIIVTLLLVAYVGSYTILSAKGRYVMLTSATLDGRGYWHPLGCENRTPSPTGRIKTEYPSLLGFFYLPLLLIDRSFIHLTVFRMGENGEFITKEQLQSQMQHDNF